MAALSRSIVFAVAIGLGAWQLLTSAPFVPPILAGGWLLLVGLVAGLRIGTLSVVRLIDDMVRLNQTVGEQNRDLCELNLQLLRQIPKVQLRDEIADDA
jgi:hypothetical protein